MRILLVMPRYEAWVNVEAASAFFRPVRPDSPLRVTGVSPGSSLLASTFNAGWALARNQYEAGEIDGFAMIHADVGAEPHWLDILHAELVRAEADLVSAVIPIKDERGLTSTAVDAHDDLWRCRRLTVTEVANLPETFTEEDVGAPLLLNTGLWLCRLGPWCLDVHFRIRDAIRRQPDGQWRAAVVPEDFDFSAQCRAQGLRLAATRAARVKHHGEWAWSNQGEPWGWATDQQNGPARKGESIQSLASV